MAFSSTNITVDVGPHLGYVDLTWLENPPGLPEANVGVAPAMVIASSM